MRKWNWQNTKKKSKKEVRAMTYCRTKTSSKSFLFNQANVNNAKHLKKKLRNKTVDFAYIIC